MIFSYDLVVEKIGRKKLVIYFALFLRVYIVHMSVMRRASVFFFCFFWRKEAYTNDKAINFVTVKCAAIKPVG